MELYEEKCVTHLRCTSNICPLDPEIEKRNHIKGDGICKQVLDYLEGKETQFDNEIEATRPIWINKFGKSVLESRLESRKHVRQFQFKTN